MHCSIPGGKRFDSTMVLQPKGGRQTGDNRGNEPTVTSWGRGGGDQTLMLMIVV